MPHQRNSLQHGRKNLMTLLVEGTLVRPEGHAPMNMRPSSVISLKD